MPDVSKLTPTVARSVRDSVSKGMSLKLAAQRAGVGERTLRRWLSLGKVGDGAENVALLAAIQKARGEAVARQVAIVMKAATGVTEKTTKKVTFADGTTKEETTSRRVFEWTAAAWWLERNHPEQYGSDRLRVRQLERQVAELMKALGQKDA